MPFIKLQGEKVRICSVCEKHDVEFYARSSASDGKRSTCKECGHKASIDWAKKNPSKVAKSRKKFYDDNFEKCADWVREAKKANPEIEKQARKKWIESNPELDYQTRKVASAKWREVNKGSVLAANARRRAKKLKACPAWANHNAIKSIYSKCETLNKASDVKYHVDHIVPLQGKLVSGLHVENNLQIITATHNLKKGSSWDSTKEII